MVFSLGEGCRIGERIGRKEDVDPSAAAVNGRRELAGRARKALEAHRERVLDEDQ